MITIDYALAYAGLGANDEWHAECRDYVDNTGNIIESRVKYGYLTASLQIVRDGQLCRVLWFPNVTEYIVDEPEGWVPDFWELDIVTAFDRILDAIGTHRFEDGSIDVIPTFASWLTGN
ncbi:hypothetical protein NZD89_20470 [Alicyclobacillus fastidiosus]|uniref:Uncharacterized protein n=1 Tax=Alicyclobacillus fastidiosus TaxID=392011 RepID=A0ABY6ZDR9_9BACL|nr:hypothetical protein [Alicyclobacillus fastidiosus]WAH40657.1 hypothetical protein NZD89_20470 [Alicyclobacillus fastidiosus]GMA62114.1 hypothetical protein GCM10025859_25540 [Alicyclobacillus fastidiosus]